MKKSKQQAQAAGKRKRRSKRPIAKRKIEQPKKKTPPVKPAACSKLSSRQEKFAQIYASGTKATEAYVAAYGPVKGAEVSASRLLSTAKISGRVKALQALAAEAAVLTLADKRKYLRSVVMTPLGHVDETSVLCQSAEYLVTGGVRGRLRRGHSESGNEETEPEMTTVKIKMPDKLKAIELDAKLAGELKAEPVKIEASDDLLSLLGLIRSGGQLPEDEE